jgi:site-specific recombinase XerD
MYHLTSAFACAMLVQIFIHIKTNNMNTNVVLALDTRRKKQDGTYSLILRIVHHRESTQITLGVSLAEKDWDDKRRVVKPSYKGTESVTRLNNRIQKKKSDALDIIGKLDEQNTLDSFTVIQLKELIEKKSSSKSFFSLGEEMMEEMLKANRIGNARSFKSSLGVLNKFCNNKDLTFQQFNYDLLVKFETAHLAKGNSLNGLAAYMRTYRAIYNEAIKKKLVDKELYPFTDYTIKTVKTRKRAIRMDVLKRIVDLKLEPKHPLYHSRNYFLISFYMRGMPFADLAELKMSDLVDGRIYYDRQKTGKPYDIKITPEIKKMLALYTKGKSKTDHIFPIIKRKELEDQYKDVMWARKRYNKKLKKIAELCKIDQNLTSYVSRHSFATQAKNLGIGVAAISDLMGHGDIKTTEIYLDSLPNDLLDKFHEQIIK